MVAKFEHLGITSEEAALALTGDMATLRPALERALVQCDDKVICTKHLLLALLEQQSIGNLFTTFQEDPVRMRRAVLILPANDRYDVVSHVFPGFSRAATKSILHSTDVAKDRGLENPKYEDLLLALLDTEDIAEYNSTLFDDFGIDIYELMEHVLNTISPV